MFIKSIHVPHFECHDRNIFLAKSICLKLNVNSCIMYFMHNCTFKTRLRRRRDIYQANLYTSDSMKIIYYYECKCLPQHQRKVNLLVYKHVLILQHMSDLFQLNKYTGLMLIMPVILYAERTWTMQNYSCVILFIVSNSQSFMKIRCLWFRMV